MGSRTKNLCAAARRRSEAENKQAKKLKTQLRKASSTWAFRTRRPQRYIGAY